MRHDLGRPPYPPLIGARDRRRCGGRRRDSCVRRGTAQVTLFVRSAGCLRPGSPPQAVPPPTPPEGRGSAPRDLWVALIVAAVKHFDISTTIEVSTSRGVRVKGESRHSDRDNYVMAVDCLICGRFKKPRDDCLVISGEFRKLNSTMTLLSYNWL